MTGGPVTRRMGGSRLPDPDLLGGLWGYPKESVAPFLRSRNECWISGSRPLSNGFVSAGAVVVSETPVDVFSVLSWSPVQT